MLSASQMYWTRFSVDERDVERVYAYILEKGQPVSTAELAEAIITARVQEEADRLARLSTRATLYQPKLTFTVGQRLVFPALKDVEGTVVAIRPSDNPRLPPFDVIEVEFEGEGNRREFAASYPLEHPLNEARQAALGAADLSPEQIQATYGQAVERELSARLAAEKDFCEVGGRWLLRGLMTDVHIGLLNVAEAAIEQNGAALTSGDLARILELDQDSARREVSLFSLEYALARDERFVDVGPTGLKRWYLVRLIPPEVVTPPRILQMPAVVPPVVPLPAELETLLNDMNVEAEGENGHAEGQTTSLILTYPHWRSGSLPITGGIRSLLPHADKPMLITFVDESGRRIPAWVVPAGSFIIGLKGWYDRHKLNPGALLEVGKTEDPLTLSLRYQPRRESKSLWVRVAEVEGGRLTFGTRPRPIAHKYDEEMLIVPENQAGLDRLVGSPYAERPLEDLLVDVVSELAKLGGGAFHAKTIYSALTFARRVGPRAVFSALARSQALGSVGGGYFVLQLAPKIA